MRKRRHLKETVPSSSITWSEMGKQNVLAEKVYSVIAEKVYDFKHVHNSVNQNQLKK